MHEWISKQCILASRVMILVGTLVFSVAVAEDAETDVSSASLVSLLSTPSYADYGHNAPGRTPFPNSMYIDTPTLIPVEFRDSSTIGRLKRIRELSLLTFTDSGKSRFYLGVNDEGVFGVHMSFLTGRESDRFAEVLRMPYLEKREDNR